MTQTISKKQCALNQTRGKADRRQAKREREQSREGHATGYKPYRETVAAKRTGYCVVKQQLPWIGAITKNGKLSPFIGINQGETKEPFFIHPITGAPTWYASSPPSEVAAVRYVYESTHPLADLPRCASPVKTFGVAV